MSSGKNIAVFFDGTWNKVSDNTNVWRAKSLLAKRSKSDRLQLAYYDIGVNGVVGGAFGKGVGDNITQAYEWLVENFEKGDDLFVFGFSRGAFTARSLVGFIAQYGLIELGTTLGVRA